MIGKVIDLFSWCIFRCNLIHSEIREERQSKSDEIMHMLSNYNIESSIAVDYNSTKKEISEKVFDLVIIDDIISELDRVKNYLLIDKTNGLLKVMDHIEYDVPRIIGFN